MEWLALGDMPLDGTDACSTRQEACVSLGRET